MESLTPAAILDLSSACFSSSICDSTLSLVGSNRMPMYQSERRYGDRTANILRITAGSSVTRSLGPMRARDPGQAIQSYTQATKHVAKRTVSIAGLSKGQVHPAPHDGADQPYFGKGCWKGAFELSEAIPCTEGLHREQTCAEKDDGHREHLPIARHLIGEVGA